MDDLSNLLRQGLDYLGPAPYLRALGVVVLFLLLAVVVDLVVRSVLRQAVRSWSTAARRELVRSAQRPVFMTVLLSGLMVATTIIEPGARVERVTIGLLQTLLILLWVGFGINGIRLMLSVLGQRQPPPTFAQPATAPLLRNTVVVVLFLAGTYAILVAWDVNVTGLVASAGILGLALSFAAQDTLGNLVAGIAILTDKPYSIGDYIVLDTGERGAVTHIGLRSTRLLTRDDVEVSIPNGIMGRAKIINESGGPSGTYRLRIPVALVYGSDIEKAMALMLAAASAHVLVCKNPEPRMRLRQLGESGLEFEMLCWIEDPALRGLVSHELNCEIYHAFNTAGVVFAFPQREVHLRHTMPTPNPR
ncbi:MAG: mechanosensitive ion channel family protein [Gammaproteobacteria bacterium]|nr:mechanosensitive ion channel family protein [Gammaproteobacteria bacterium]